MQTYYELRDTYHVEPTNLRAKHAVEAFCRDHVVSHDGTLFTITFEGKRTEHILLPPQQQPSELTLKRLGITLMSAHVLFILTTLTALGLAFAHTAGANIVPGNIVIASLVSTIVIAGGIILFKMDKLQKSIREQRNLKDLKDDIKNQPGIEPFKLDIPTEPNRLHWANKDRGYCHITTEEDLKDVHAIDRARSKGEASSKRYAVAAAVIAVISVTLFALSAWYGQQFASNSSINTSLYVSIGTLPGAILGVVFLGYLLKKASEKEHESEAAAWLTWRTDKLLKEMKADGKFTNQLYEEFQEMDLGCTETQASTLKTNVQNKYLPLSFDARQFIANLWAHYYLAERIRRTWRLEGGQGSSNVVYLSLMQCLEQFKPARESIEVSS